MPTISVIVPVYKVEPYLRRCVDSILGQTFTDFELILVDDGSPDNCPAICDEYAAIDNRVHVIHQENGGLSAARNAGIDWAFANSDSQWLIFIDSDDWVHPEMIAQLYNTTQNLHVAISICGYAETNGEEPIIKPSDCDVSICTPEDFYRNHYVNATVAWGKIYHKSCFCDIRYPVGKIHEDEYITYRILFSQQHLGIIHAPYYAYFINPKGITKENWTQKRMDCFAAFEEQITYFSENGYDTVRRFRIRGYMQNIFDQLSLIEKSQNKDLYKKYKSQMIRKARGILFKYRKENIFTIPKDAWIFERCYPHAMYIYWLYKAAMKKLSWGNRCAGN